MIAIRKSGERGQSRTAWLDSKHSFSFAGYNDPDWMEFRTLRVLNEDRVEPGAGFGMHGHNEMEIVSYVVSGALEHRDSLGNGSVLRAGDVQCMTAGTGIRHSEMNPSQQETVHFLQVWILPETHGLQPGYEERNFAEREKEETLRLIVSPHGGEGSLRIHQDFELYASVLDSGRSVEHAMRPGRHGWVQVIKGVAALNGVRLEHGDGAAVSDETALRLEGVERTELLLFDLS